VSTRPLLLLDVDGPINPFAAPSHRRPAGYGTHHLLPDTWKEQFPGVPEQRIKPLRVWLNPDLGAHLLALPFELVWATTWEHDANEWIGPRIGLPDVLPVIEFGDQSIVRLDGTYVKTWPIVEFAQGRPFAWVDDQILDVDREYVAARHDGPALLHYVDPAKGLTAADFATLTEWAACLAASSEAGGTR
jgi:hypothetical protein